MTLPTPYYERDGITIYHARCEDVIPHVSPSTVDLLLADPPYGVNEQTNRASKGRGSLAPCYDFEPVFGDDKPFDPLPLLAYPRVLLFGANHFSERLPSSPSWIVWDKRDGIPSNDNADCELIWSNLGGPARLYRHVWNGMIKASEQTQRRVHPTQKPVALMRWLVERFSKPGDLIFDPYMGSGPIAAACHQLGRRYIGVELVETYCATAVKRLQQSVMNLGV